MDTIPNLISGMIIKACEMILAERYVASLALIKVSRAYDAQNEFLHFLDHRMEKFYQEAAEHDMSPEERRGFIRSLQGIVIEALEKAELAPTFDLDDKKINFLQAIKNSLFARAEYYMGREEYHFALAEIQRVFVIEPSSSDARQLEQRLEQLISGNSGEKESDQQISANRGNIFVIQATKKAEEAVPAKS